MKSYDESNIKQALIKVGLRKNQNLFVHNEIFRFGFFNTKKNLNIYEAFYKIIRELIGPKGTICTNTYTYDTLRHKKKFIYESDWSTAGGFARYLLKQKKTIRSHHPVFSVGCNGPNSKFFCKKNSSHNYGYNSPYDKFIRFNKGESKKILILGGNPVRNAFFHVAEHMIGVSYMFNKFTKVNYYMKNRKIKKKFSSFVRYMNTNSTLKLKLIEKKFLSSRLSKKTKLGNGCICFYDANKFLNFLLELMTKNSFYILSKEKFKQEA